MQSQNKFLKPIFVLGWACVSIMAIWQIRTGRSDSSAVLVAGAVLTASFAFSTYALRLRLRTAPMLYLALLGLFHLGLVVPWALGVYDINRMPWFEPFGLSRALALITYSILAYQLGSLVALRGEPLSTASLIERSSQLENSNLFAAGNSLFVFGAIMFVLGLTQLDRAGYYKLTYSETFRLRAESDPRFFGTGMTFASIGLCIAVAGASKRRLRITLFGAGTWALVLFYLGFRGPALIVCLIVYTLALKKGTKFPQWFPLLAAVCLLVAIPIMGVVRDQPLNNRSVDKSPNILDAPAEMGQSLKPLVETEALVGPGEYRYGKTYWLALKGIVPNLALRWETPNTELLDELPPSHWLTAIVEPWTFKNYGGIGFSAVAEPYLNFGVLGVIFYFLLLGFLLVRLEQVSIRSSYTLAIWGLILGPLLWTTRNDFSNFFRPATWGLVCLGIVHLYSRGFELVGRVLKKYEPEIDVSPPRVSRIKGSL